MKQVTMESVKERIAALEGANNIVGIGLHAEFELACLRELVAVTETVRLLTEQRDAVVAEAAQMRQIIDSITNLDNEPQYHEQGMGCGLEDRNITDRYEAMRHGWDEAMERVYAEVIPCAEELSFPATESAIAALRAEVLPPNIAEIIDSGDLESILFASEASYSQEYRMAFYNFRQLRESKGANHE